MNVTFHTLGAVATAGLLSSRRDVSPRVIGIGFASGILIHGLLDFAPHAYPIGSSVDVFLSLGLFLTALLLAQRRNWVLLVACFVGSILPDLIDLGPPLLNKRFGLALPVVKLFPWHWREYSGSVYDGRRALPSALLHISVLTIAAIILYFFRKSFFRVRSNCPSPSTAAAK